MLSALIIGYGSIGYKHAKILNTMDEFSNVTVLSGQTSLSYDTITDLKDILILDPDYIVISSSTDLHHSQLNFIEKHLSGKKILIEKPLFHSFFKMVIKQNQVFVGYNLRFHPLIIMIKDLCKNKTLFNINVFCGSYLPDWRPGRDYRKTSSSRAHLGGGVLLDLSHELDYVNWFAGPLDVKYVVSEKVSDLEIDSDDLLIFSGINHDDAKVHITLNYFTREPIRKIIIDGENLSIQGDLISNTLSVFIDGKKSDYSWPKFNINDTYKNQHRAILESDTSSICTFKEGLDIMSVIDNIRSWGKL